MATIQFLSGERLLSALLLVAGWATLAPGATTLEDAPVAWYDADDSHIAKPSTRDPSLMQDAIETAAIQPVGRVFYPARQIRNLGTLFGGDHVVAAKNVNALDEVPNSTWFTNRIGLFAMSPQAAASGPGAGHDPAPTGSWTVVRAKSEGTTLGFTVRDENGNEFLLKFDPQGHRGLTTAAGVISSRIMHAAGYNVPAESVVYFPPDILRLAPSAQIVPVEGRPRAMTDDDLAAILAAAPMTADGRYRALASRVVEGESLGPFSFLKQRGDDPNDRIPHPDRRELRGLRMFAAWLAHFDTKQHNTLDVYVEDDGRRFVRHYLIDFASSLGAGAHGPVARPNHEYVFAPGAVAARVVTLGFVEPHWRRVQRPVHLREVGYFDANHFDPLGFRPQLPNSAFRNMTDRDGYWAAKIISAFSDDHLIAIVREGQYENPAAAAYVATVLAARRDAIARTFFERVTPLDHFRLRGEVLHFSDLGIDRGVYETSARYRSRLSSCDAEGHAGEWSPWRESAGARVDMTRVRSTENAPFIAVEVQVNRGRAWSNAVRAYVASSGVVAVRR